MLASINNYTAIDEPGINRGSNDYNVYPHLSLHASVVISHTQEKGLNFRILNLLSQYAQLKDNWDGNDAIAPSKTALKEAIFLTRVLGKHGQSVFHAAPGPNGEIMLDLRSKFQNHSVEIIFYANKSVAVMFPENGCPMQVEYNESKLPELLYWLNKQ